MTTVDTADPTAQAPALPAAAPARRWWRTAGISIVMVLVFAAGYLTHAARQVLAVPVDTSAEAGFARDMSKHHAQAVAMALIAWQRATSPATRAMAAATITAQQYQIGVMQTWLADWHLPPTANNPPMAWIPGGTRMLTSGGRMPGMASRDELDRLDHAQGQQVDVLFCQLMIRHHLGGLHMIDAVLARSHRPEVLDLAGKMRITQEADIANMRDMLADLGAAP